MVEFCENCGGMMLPSKDKNDSILVCNSCGQTKPLEKDIIKSYKFHTEIYHPPGKNSKILKR